MLRESREANTAVFTNETSGVGEGGNVLSQIQRGNRKIFISTYFSSVSTEKSVGKHRKR